jgi:ABC-type hemin transport system ATPase subunit
VTEIVALGLTPHHGLMGRDGAEDREAVAEAVERCGVGPFADRDHATLSGGERQRVLPARALAQRPRLLALVLVLVLVLVLDELTMRSCTTSTWQPGSATTSSCSTKARWWRRAPCWRS